MSALLGDLERIFGEFHSSFRDATARTRSARSVLTSAEIGAVRFDVGKGATRYESLIVDETLHSVFIEIAQRSLASTPADRKQQEEFIERITRGAITVVGTPVTFTNVVESHVWCSVVAEKVVQLTTQASAIPAGRSYAGVGYPRQSASRLPQSLAGVRSQGLQHLDDALAAFSSLSVSQVVDLLRLVGAATCPDPWHHAAVVRYCLEPFVTAALWAPSNATKIVNSANFDDLRRRWQSKRHW
ncbi:hypothetical protein [Glaciihabitans sp. dw_435]|uniref:hypothetical protein n=1 Tax=Glaciihabitans sp. dw_435 TaxID=2720081 RepID=UPI001BD62AC1|nr:hypothetical protein [Glaciihabitans sp. dw_435]